ncbi:MAG: hypothetical protein H9W81_02580 [Enterococcus sp.]|nr:hypothetical protein [Enterococcus sp.]
MKAIVRRFRRNEWEAVTITTNPLKTSIEGKEQEEHWLNGLPSVLVNGRSTEIRENPEGWIASASGMRYTRFTVEIVEA